MARHGHGRNTSRLIFGLFILMAGVLFAYGELTGRDLVDLLRYWPAVFVVVGLAQLSDARGRRAFLGAAIWIAAGALLLLYNLDVLPFNVFDLTPLLIAVLGAHLVRRSFSRLPLPGAAAGTASPWVRALAVMGGVQRRHRSRHFAGGDVTAIMGGCEIDLTRCAIADEEAVLDTFALWGGIEVRVPEGWEVTGEVLPILGGFDDKTTLADTPPAGRLRLRGFAIMGGVEVHH